MFQIKQLLRRMVKTPLFTAVTLLTLAIGIGANTAIFSVVYCVLLQPLPYPEPEALIGVWQTAPGLNIARLNASPATYFLYREENRSFEDIGLWSTGAASVTGVAEPERVRTLDVTDGTLPLLRVVPALGRIFRREDDLPKRPETILLSYGYFQRKFGADPKVIGQRLMVDGNAMEVIGVLPERFRFLDQAFDIVMPFQFDRNEVFVGNFSFQAIARLKPGVTLAQASADVARMIPLLVKRFKLAPGMSATVIEESRMAPLLTPLKEEIIGDAAPVLWVLMATVGIVLFIACANVANLLLVRAEGRQQELAVRAALGASWGRIAQELLAESLALSMMGGVAGLALAFWAIQLLRRLAPANLPRIDELAINPAMLLFAVAISLLSGISFGLATVFKFAGPKLQTALRAGSRNFSDGKQRNRTRDLLVILQVTLALVLLVGAGLMIRSAMAMRQVDPGFRKPEELLTLRISIPEAQVKDEVKAARMQQEIQRMLGEIPGVSSVGISTSITMDGAQSFDPVWFKDFPTQESKLPKIRRYKHVGPGYFTTMGNPLAAGRDVSWTDVIEMRPVIIVSKNLALEYWKSPNEALGKLVRERPNGTWREIIGVAGDDRSDGVDKKAPTTAYWPILKSDFWSSKVSLTRSVGYVIRSPRAGTAAFLKDVQRAVWGVNPQLPLANVRTVQELYDRSMARTSFTMVMLSLSGGMALLLGVIGIYGVISYSATQRTREIGIRIALGAMEANIQRMFLGHGMALAMIGIVCGAGVSIPLTQLMSTLLFEVSAMDAWTYALVALFLLSAAGLAAYLPARRASRIAPVEALRGD